MGMKKTSILKDVPTTTSGGVLPVPPVPAVPQSPVMKKAVQPLEQKEKAYVEKAGDDKMTKKDWADKSVGISIDAIHKSSLEGNTLAQATIGLSWPDVLKKSEEFVRFHVALNQKIKGE